MRPEGPPEPAAGELRGSLRKLPAGLDSRETASVFDGMDWNGNGWRAKASPPPSLRQPASSYFADFPWGD